MSGPPDRDALKDAFTARGLELEETHISWVFLGGSEVWKIKKPKSLGFLDFGSAEKRRRACEAEVRLNARLAPDVYLGVVPVTRDPGGDLCFDGPGETVDWAVHMRRLPRSDRADVRLEQGRLDDGHLQALARRLAIFHRTAAEAPEFGTVETVAKNVEENFEQTRGSLERYLTPEQAEELRTYQADFLEDRHELFERRIRQGRIREGHGDLRLEHVYFPDGGRPTVVDCIEFNRRFRFGDVSSDVAFLAMDLTWRDRSGAAERFLAAYAREADDYDLYTLVDFYESYRSFVRGKVMSFVADDPQTTAPTRKKAAAEARRFFLLALASERRSLVPPRLIAVGGDIASGKSTVADELGRLSGAPVIDSDRTRKHLLGVEPEKDVHVPPFTGPYDERANRRVYREVLRRAREVLESGRTVIVDASFARAEDRAAFRDLAQELDVPFTYGECRADRETRRQRLLKREEERCVSDGRLEIMDEVTARREPADELADDEKIVVPTDRGEPDLDPFELAEVP